MASHYAEKPLTSWARLTVKGEALLVLSCLGTICLKAELIVLCRRQTGLYMSKFLPDIMATIMERSRFHAVKLATFAISVRQQPIGHFEPFKSEALLKSGRLLGSI